MMDPVPQPITPGSPQPADSTAPSDAGRRCFLHACMGGMSLVSAGTVAYPIVSFMRLPSTLAESQVLRIPLASLSEDQALYHDHMGQSLVVLYTNKTPKVFDAACTHLGCIVAWDGVQRTFRCPCHGAVFDDEGKPVSGPVSRPLVSIGFEIANNELVVS